MSKKKQKEKKKKKTTLHKANGFLQICFENIFHKKSSKIIRFWPTKVDFVYFWQNKKQANKQTTCKMQILGQLSP